MKCNIHADYVSHHNRNRQELPQQKKVIYKKPTVTSHLMAKDRTLSLKVKNKAKMLIFTTFIQHCSGVLANWHKAI